MRYIINLLCLLLALGGGGAHAAFFFGTWVEAGLGGTPDKPFAWDGTKLATRDMQIVSGWMEVGTPMYCPHELNENRDITSIRVGGIHLNHGAWVESVINVDGKEYSPFYWPVSSNTNVYLGRSGALIARISLDNGPFVPVRINDKGGDAAQWGTSSAQSSQILWEGKLARHGDKKINIRVQYAVVQNKTTTGVEIKNLKPMGVQSRYYQNGMFLSVGCVTRNPYSSVNSPPGLWTVSVTSGYEESMPATTCDYVGNSRYAIDLGEHDGDLVKNYSAGTNFGNGVVKLEFLCDQSVKPYVTLSDGKDSSNTSDIVKTTVPGVGVQAFNSNVGGGSTAIKMGPQSKNIGTANQFSIKDMLANVGAMAVNTNVIFKYVKTSEALDLSSSNTPEATVLATFAYQ